MTGWERSIIERIVPGLLCCAALSGVQAQEGAAPQDPSPARAVAQDVLSDTAVIDLTNRVIGGNRARPGQFPSIVALLDAGLFSPADRQFCGGTVIDARWVVTAAHCLHDNAGQRLDPANIRIVEQVLDLRAETIDEEVMVTNMIVHESYDHASTETYDDIALLELATALDSPPAALFTEDPERFAGTSAVVAGWGAIEYRSPQFVVYPDALQQASVPLVTRSVCNAPDSYDFIAEGQLCAGFIEGGVDGCLGDSGGPLITVVNGRPELIGVTSFGRGCAEPHFYGIYTSVSSYLDWIGQYVAVRTLPAGGDNLTGGKGEDADRGGGAVGGVDGGGGLPDEGSNGGAAGDFSPSPSEVGAGAWSLLSIVSMLLLWLGRLSLSGTRS